jgi:hypothetical protein
VSISDRLLDRLKADWVTTTLGILTAGVVILTFAGAVLYGPDIVNSTNAVERGTDLTGCRSSYNAEVTDRRTAFDIARSERDTVDSEADVLLLSLAENSIFGNGDRIDDLREQIVPKRIELAEHNERVKAADAALIEANAAYQEAIALSRDDPEGFVADCKENHL